MSSTRTAGTSAAPSFTDVALIPGDFAPCGEYTPAGADPIHLSEGLSLERLPSEMAEEVLDAATPRGRDFDATRQFSQRYAFVRHHAPAEPTFTFDSDGLLQTALQLSRLVVPNAHDTDYAVRIIDSFYITRPHVIVPLEPHARFFAFTAGEPPRAWLTDAEGRDLANLLTRFLDVRDGLSSRVKHGLWLAEWGARLPYLQLAVINTVTALEALVTTDRSRLRAQFKHRSRAVADELGREIDDALLDRQYSARSEAVHGAFVPVDEPDTQTDELAQLQRVLQLALRRAIEDDDFAAIFASADTIRERWPLPPPAAL